MKLLVISSAPVVEIDGKSHLYAPYEKEMQLWAKHTNSIQFCCPVWFEGKKLLITPISFRILPTIVLHEFDIKTFLNTLKAIPKVFKIGIQLFKAIKETNSPVETYLSASGVGYYGDRADEVLDEESLPGNDFLAECCILWEKAAEFTVRTLRNLSHKWYLLQYHRCHQGRRIPYHRRRYEKQPGDAII